MISYDTGKHSTSKVSQNRTVEKFEKWIRSCQAIDYRSLKSFVYNVNRPYRNGTSLTKSCSTKTLPWILHLSAYAACRGCFEEARYGFKGNSALTIEKRFSGMLWHYHFSKRWRLQLKHSTFTQKMKASFPEKRWCHVILDEASR